MVITIIQEKKKRRYLLLALAVMIFAILFIIWSGFFRKGEEVPEIPAVVYIIPKVGIDWRVLDEVREQTLMPFEEISAFEGKFGRENPFMPY